MAAPITLTYVDRPVFVYEFHYRLGSVARDLETMKAENLLAGEVETLRAIGYNQNFGLADDETLMDLASEPLLAALRMVGDTGALVFQHCNAESAVLPCEPGDAVGASRNRYFPGELMRAIGLDDLPYFCSFASGCAGFLSLLVTAGGLRVSANNQPTGCVMADSRPPNIPFDLLRERILGTDHSSTFIVGPDERGYQLLGIDYYSTTRRLVPLVEIVKRTVQMIQELAATLRLNLGASEVVIHYPNIFPDTWKMVTRYLRLPHLESVMDGIAERAHCGATDSVITLSKFHAGKHGRIHIVVNYGVGLHLGICVLREQANGSIITEL